MDEIQILEGLEGIRRRPGMYVGSADADGLHNIVWFLVRDVIDIHLARAATEVQIDIGPDGWVSVRDDGIGIPIEPRPYSGRPHLEELCTATFAGGWRDPTRYRFLAPINALSTSFEIETTRDGVRWAQSFERGKATSPLRRLGATDVEGTSIRFRPDSEIFGASTIDIDRVGARLQQIAWLHPLLRVFFQGKRLPGIGGLARWASETAPSPIEGAFAAHDTVDDVLVDVAVAWSGLSEPTIFSFANSEETRGGTHVDGLWRGLAGFARRVAAARRTVDDVRQALGPGLVAIVHVGLSDPDRDVSRSHLRSPVAATVVSAVLERELRAAAWRDIPLRELLITRLDLAWPPTPPA